MWEFSERFFHIYFCGKNFTPNHHQRSDTRQSKLFSGLMVAWLVKHRVDFHKINMDWHVTTIGIYWMRVGLLLGVCVCTYSSEKGVRNLPWLCWREASRVEMHKVPLRCKCPNRIQRDTVFRVHYLRVHIVKTVKFQAEFSSIVCIASCKHTRINNANR